MSTPVGTHIRNRVIALFRDELDKSRARGFIESGDVAVRKTGVICLHSELSKKTPEGLRIPGRA